MRVAVEVDVAAMHPREDTVRIMRAPNTLDPAIGKRNLHVGDIEDRAVPGQARADLVVVAPNQELAAVEPREDLPGPGLGAAVAEVAEVPDGVAWTDGRVPARDQALVVGLDGVEGTSLAEAVAQYGPMPEMMVA